MQKIALKKSSIAGMKIRLGEPLTPGNAKAIAEKVISMIPPSSETAQGRGIVIAAGGERYFPCAWVCVKMLRYLGCSLPIQFWYLGGKELNRRMKEIVAPLGVECVDALEIRKKHPTRILTGWELKPYAIIHSSYKEVLFLDADNVPVADPTFLFETPQFRETGAIFWPDYGRLAQSRPIWKICGIEYRDEPEFESGQIVIDKDKCWKALRLCMWYNEHSDFFYEHIHGDKETFHLAFRKLGQEYSMPKKPIFPLQGTMCQHDFKGKRLFQHRNLEKWMLFGGNRRISGFMHEDKCLSFLDELGKMWDGRINRPSFQIASKSESLRKIALELTQTPFIYERVGYDTRPMRFLPNGAIGTGAAACEIYWDIEEFQNDIVLKIFSYREMTCEFRSHDDGIWRGRWLYHERMPVQLVPISQNGG